MAPAASLVDGMMPQDHVPGDTSPVAADATEALVAGRWRPCRVLRREPRRLFVRVFGVLPRHVVIADKPYVEIWRRAGQVRVVPNQGG